MADLINYTFNSVYTLLTSPVFSYAVAVVIVPGCLGIIGMVIGGKK